MYNNDDVCGSGGKWAKARQKVSVIFRLLKKCLFCPGFLGRFMTKGIFDENNLTMVNLVFHRGSSS